MPRAYIASLKLSMDPAPFGFGSLAPKGWPCVVEADSSDEAFTLALAKLEQMEGVSPAKPDGDRPQWRYRNGGLSTTLSLTVDETEVLRAPTAGEA